MHNSLVPIPAENVPGRTRAPGRYILVYDGQCRFCTAGARRCVALMGRVPVEMVDFQQPGALERFPGLTHEACLQAMQLVTPDGRIFSGFEAGVQALATRPVLGRLVSLYYLPGLRRLLDRVYRIVAANRYRIMGRALARGGCPGGSCALHLPQKREKK